MIILYLQNMCLGVITGDRVTASLIAKTSTLSVVADYINVAFPSSVNFNSFYHHVEVLKIVTGEAMRIDCTFSYLFTLLGQGFNIFLNYYYCSVSFNMNSNWWNPLKVK